MVLLILVVVVCLLAYSNGSNDNIKPVATLYGAGVLDYRQSITLATLAQLVGSAGSVLLAGGLLKAFSGKGLVGPDLVGDPVFLLSVGAAAACTVGVATSTGMPVSTTHALIGGLVGAGLAMSDVPLVWEALGSKYLVPLLVSPLLATGATVALYPVARWAGKWIGQGLPSGAPGGDPGCTPEKRLLDAAHIASAFALGASRGLNDTPKILALLVATGWSGLSPAFCLAGVAVVMAAGGILHARAIAEMIGHRITTMTDGQALVANGVASSLVIGASLLGAPVSTTHVSTGAVFGIGVWSGTADHRVIVGILLAWLATLPMGAGLSYILASVLS